MPFNYLKINGPQLTQRFTRITELKLLSKCFTIKTQSIIDLVYTSSSSDLFLLFLIIVRIWDVWEMLVTTAICKISLLCMLSSSNYTSVLFTTRSTAVASIIPYIKYFLVYMSICCYEWPTPTFVILFSWLLLEYSSPPKTSPYEGSMRVIGSFSYNSRRLTFVNQDVNLKKR